MRATILVALAALAILPGCIRVNAASRERQITRTFEVQPGATVSVDISGGSIVLRPGASDTVKVVLTEIVNADSDQDADERLGHYEVVLEQEGDRVVVRARRKPGRTGWVNGVSFRAEVEAPAATALDLKTSGGRIAVEGERTAPMVARTSGGSVRVDGGSSDIDLRTSGGSIEVGRALGKLAARTSGGSIRVDYVGTASRDVTLQTSGGSITAALDPGAAFDIEARTSGGSVRVDDLPVTRRDQDRRRTGGRSRFDGAINGGGGGRFTAQTSGGSIRIRASN